MPRTNTIGGRGTLGPGGEPVNKEVPYISFSAVIGRNSHFKDLTEEQMDELGGVEYRALRVLLVIVALVRLTSSRHQRYGNAQGVSLIGQYFFLVQFLAGIIIWPYIAAGGRYDYVFEGQFSDTTIGWYAMFQAVSAFSNTGMSLVDASMLPFQTAYLEIVRTSSSFHALALGLPLAISRRAQLMVVLIILILAGNTAFVSPSFRPL